MVPAARGDIAIDDFLPAKTADEVLAEFPSRENPLLPLSGAQRERVGRGGAKTLGATHTSSTPEG